MALGPPAPATARLRLAPLTRDNDPLSQRCGVPAGAESISSRFKPQAISAVHNNQPVSPQRRHDERPRRGAHVPAAAVARSVVLCALCVLCGCFR